MKKSVWAAVVLLCLAPWCVRAESVCPRPEPGSLVEEPEDLRSQNGVLEARLTISDGASANGSTLYCYTDAAGHESPNLRVRPGDLVILHLKNELTDPSGSPTEHAHGAGPSEGSSCSSVKMSPVSTNLHFHGL